MWSHHDDELMHHHASPTDRPTGGHQLRSTPAARAVGGTEARAVTAVSSAKLMSFVVRCGANGAHELKKIALGRQSDRPAECCCCCWWSWCG